MNAWRPQAMVASSQSLFVEDLLSCLRLVARRPPCRCRVGRPVIRWSRTCGSGCRSGPFTEVGWGRFGTLAEAPASGVGAFGRAYSVGLYRQFPVGCASGFLSWIVGTAVGRSVGSGLRRRAGSTLWPGRWLGPRRQGVSGLGSGRGRPCGRHVEQLEPLCSGTGTQGERGPGLQ